MNKDFPGEQWKTVTFDFEFSNDYRIDVSNFGRLRTFNKQSNGNIVTGSMVNGYKIIRLKFFKSRDAKTLDSINYLQNQALQLTRKIKLLKQNYENPTKIAEATELLKTVKNKTSKKIKADVKERTIHYHSLVHRLVATYFCSQPSKEHTIVAHLDYDKLNNRHTNLQWMTPEENFEHQRKSPNVLSAKRGGSSNPASRVNKLTVTRVMLLKKLLNQGKPIRTLIKQFKITDTQILRIKRGENWGDIEAAK